MLFDDLQTDYRYIRSNYSPHVKIVKRVPANSLILDVGCNWGYLAKELKAKNCKVYGIELDKDVSEKARQFCEDVIAGDIEMMGALAFSEGYFDVMIFNDVLEHLKRPDIILSRFKRYLKPAGFVIASIPNIARLEYRLKHLFGNFDYEPRGGLLSCTHLRHFTLKTAKKLFEDSGYKITDVSYTGLGSKLNIFPNLLAFQFLITAKIKG